MQNNRESMHYDVIIVGAGPAGLSAAIRYAQLAKQHNLTPQIAVIEKGAEVGAHIISGAVFEPTALNELIPDWKEKNAPLDTAVSQDEFRLLTQKSSYKLPLPPTLRNHGNYIISLGKLCQWLAKEAEQLGVAIFPGFAATSILYDQDNSDNHTPAVIGIGTGDMGLDKQGAHKSTYQPGVNIYAKQTIFAEGCRGSLTQSLIKNLALDKHCSPQTYGLGIKEIWEIDKNNPLYTPGKVTHTIGWPVDNSTYGGGFIYHLNNNLISIGYIIGLDYQNPYLNPYEEFQRFKHHPAIQPLLNNGRCISYGARALNEGGFQSIPQLTFKGGVLIGCAAGFLNIAKIKGSHTAMKTGMLAAESIFESLHSENNIVEITQYPVKLQSSWVWKELYQARNIRPAFKWGLWAGLVYSAVDQYILRGKAPWSFTHQKDNTTLTQATLSSRIIYPKSDNKISFDKLTSLTRSNVAHEENQVNHLKLGDPTIAIDINYRQYDSPETRYCPAGVYEIVQVNQQMTLQINAQNCIHCKSCDIKDPKQNITWTPPEGGGGPNYINM